MNNEALLTAIAEMMVMQFRELEEGLEKKFEKMLDEKLAPIYERLDRLETRMGAIETRMDAIESDMKDVKKRLANIEGAFYEEFHPLLVTHAIPRLSSVERKLEDEVIPQLNHTRNFAEATYKLATTAMDWLSTMQADIDALKIIVQQHSKLLA